MGKPLRPLLFRALLLLLLLFPRSRSLAPFLALLPPCPSSPTSSPPLCCPSPPALLLFPVGRVEILGGEGGGGAVEEGGNRIGTTEKVMGKGTGRRGFSLIHLDGGDGRDGWDLRCRLPRRERP
ncbi:hypothetical protein GGS23DRAFT_556239 [Durotheca rogersii]|uniref:uncharacterized protein n=1 Tax=Durotheca rogersii TaxID=419775 RepID=UPI0022203B72|nr:uncharacterized protein GGS23DRAFT_556239 [Durotheca rogersii]KAI5866258.1 hypothetical protein GGS23DRAFT_556239 [Durotheca rogersii]